MSELAALLHFLAIAGQGVFAGSNLTEASVLVPYWRSLTPAEFYAYYGANDRRLFRYFATATVLAALPTFAAAPLAFAVSRPGAGLLALSAALSVAYVAMFPLFFARVNAAFSAASIPGDRLPAELARWHALHSVRTLISIAAFGAAVAALF